MTILGGPQRVQFGTTPIDYELTYSDRKTLAIHVYPDSSVVVDAPLNTPVLTVEQKVLKRAGWILRRQRQFQTYAAPQVFPRRYVSGESYRYLGRQYRLKVVEDTIERVRLNGGYLAVHVRDTADKSHIAKLLDAWYRRHARRVFDERLALVYPRVQSLGIPKPELSIRAMKSRWGSCSTKGTITLNLRLVQLPKPLIDYVILHELCHLREHNHSAAFYALLTRVLPDWRDRRRELTR